MSMCKFCGYSWRNRTDDPKMCPKCKKRLDYVYKRTVKDKNVPGMTDADIANLPAEFSKEGLIGSEAAPLPDSESEELGMLPDTNKEGF
jgi:hypothetical protein